MVYDNEKQIKQILNKHISSFYNGVQKIVSDLWIFSKLTKAEPGLNGRNLRLELIYGLFCLEVCSFYNALQSLIGKTCREANCLAHEFSLENQHKV